MALEDGGDDFAHSSSQSVAPSVLLTDARTCSSIIKTNIEKLNVESVEKLKRQTSR